MKPWPDPEILNETRYYLSETLKTKLRKGKECLHAEDYQLLAAKQGLLEAAMVDLLKICRQYQEAIFASHHSIRVKTIQEDFSALRDILEKVDRPEAWKEKVRNRIKTMKFESRKWIAELPFQSAAKALPPRHGLSTQERFEHLKDLWVRSDAARLMPPPQYGAARRNLPGFLALSETRDLPHIAMDPLDGTKVVSRQALAQSDSTECLTPTELQNSWEVQNNWRFQPNLLLELLILAEESLLLETGADVGGDTSFHQQQCAISPKDSFSFSCLLIFEHIMGLGSARQSNDHSMDMTAFEKFLNLACQLAIGHDPEIWERWKIGNVPKERAIRTNRVWIKLFRLAGVDGPESFKTLDKSLQGKALEMLSDLERSRLKPHSTAWV